MKKFNYTCPVSMICTQEQADKEIYPELNKRGYKGDWLIPNGNDKQIIVFTNQSGDNDLYSNAICYFHHHKNDYNRHFTDHYNPELFLALASCTDKADGNYGEYYLNDTGGLYKCPASNLDWTCDKYKASKEILINHFTMKDKEEPKLIGYKLIKPEYKFAASVIVSLSDNYFNDSKIFPKGGFVESELEKAGVLDLWFERVYEEPKPDGCTLTDTELILRVEKRNSELCKSGVKSWSLSVPVDPNNDPDLLIAELCKRFKNTLS